MHPQLSNRDMVQEGIAEIQAIYDEELDNMVNASDIGYVVSGEKISLENEFDAAIEDLNSEIADLACNFAYELSPQVEETLRVSILGLATKIDGLNKAKERALQKFDILANYQFSLQRRRCRQKYVHALSALPS